MANFKTALAMENEIFKASDFNFGYDSIIANIATAMKAVLSGNEGNYVIGGKVKPYGSGGLNVSIEPVYGFCNSTGVCVAESDTTEPVSFEEADSSLDRIDIIEICGTETGYDSQSRKFIDPSTGTETTQTVNTKKKIALTVVVKKGSNGSESAPAVDSGYVKIAEVRIPAGTNNITEDLIKNIDARKYGVNNTDWTTNKAATFNPSYLANIFHTFLENHNEDGSHKNAVIKAANIDFGTGAAQVKGSSMPTGQSMSVHGVDFTSTQSVTDLIVALANNTNNLYKYSNDILSRFSFADNLPVACSTANVDIATGGEMTIDGVSCTIGQLVFLKNQTDAKENGFYEVQSGEWNRYAGYTSAMPDAFKHKLILIKAGANNKGKIFYLNGDFEQIGTDELNFAESNFSTFAKSYTIVARDSGGRIKAATPVDNDDVIRKVEYTALQNITNPDFKAALLNYCYPIGSIYWSSNSTNPSELFGGTWTPIKDKFIWAKGDSDTINDTGGSKTVTLLTENLPPHTHDMQHYHNRGQMEITGAINNSGGTFGVTGFNASESAFSGVFSGSNFSGKSRAGESDNGSAKVITFKASNGWTGKTSGSLANSTVNDITAKTDTGSTGSGVAHENMPPYVVKYCWERTE